MKVRERVWMALLILVLIGLCIGSYYAFRYPHVIEFHQAVDEGRVEDVERYIDSWWLPVDAKYQWQTALVVAIDKRQSRIIDLLLEAGADPGARADDGSRAIEHAAAFAPGDVFFRMLETGAEFDVNASVLGKPILTQRMHWRGGGENEKENNRKVVQYLLDEGADATIVAKPFPLIHRAAFYGDPELVRILYEAGAKINVTDYRGGYPLHLALNLDLEVVKMLVACGADPALPNAAGLTPLEYFGSIRKEDLDQETQKVVEYLESLEADE